MNTQAVFETIVNHLITQYRPAKTKQSFCKYKTEDGLKCAIGCLLTDKEYDPKMENKTVWHLKEYNMLPERYIDVPLDFLTEMQSLHDDETRTTFVLDGRFLRDLQDIAKKWHLSLDFLEV